MDAILQTTLLNVFSWVWMFRCRLKFHFSLFQVSTWQYSNIDSDNGLAPNRRQSTIWNNHVLSCRHMHVSVGLNVWNGNIFNSWQVSILDWYVDWFVKWSTYIKLFFCFQRNHLTNHDLKVKQHLWNISQSFKCVYCRASCLTAAATVTFYSTTLSWKRIYVTISCCIKPHFIILYSLKGECEMIYIVLVSILVKPMHVHAIHIWDNNQLWIH